MAYGDQDMTEILEQGYSQVTGYYITLYSVDGRYFVCSQNDPRDIGEEIEAKDEDHARDIFDNLMGF